MRKSRPHLLRNAAVAVAVSVALFAGSSSPAAAAAQNRITFQDAGPLGNFDLDLGVDNTLSGANAKTYGTHSYTWRDTDGLFQVRSYLGSALDSNPRHLSSVAQLNSNHRYNDPIEGNIGWSHEVATVAWNPVNRKWVFIWMTFPKQDSADPYDANLIKYGWIGLRTMNNTTNAFPDPDPSTLSSTERRLFVGSLYDDRLQSTTDSWASGTPTNPIASPSYLAYAEPGAFYVGNTLYLALSGHRVTGSKVVADVQLLKSTDDGSTWTHVGKVLDASDAAEFNFTFDFFTAASLYTTAQGQQRILVTPVNWFGTYRGAIEFEFTNIAAATLERSGGKPVAKFTIPDNLDSGHFGAASFHPGIGNRQFSKHIGSDPTPFQVYEYVP